MSPDFTGDIRLLCIPNAGGGPALFRTWSQQLDPEIGVYSALLPGQASRLREIPPTETDVLVEQMIHASEAYLDEPFALFGYSMGALIAFEMARYLRRHGLPQPLALFIGARRAPQLTDLLSPLHQLPDAQFVQAVQSRYGGMPLAILQDAEMMALFTPILRANFAMIESYQYTEEAPFDFPILAFGGTRDRTTNESQLRAWSQHTRSNFDCQIFDGEHFFIQQHQDAVIVQIRQSLQPYIR
ncbi:MAG: putative thioesterase [Anaerolineae bacterium]|nr:putative thioesterase [Anaerolineae bacterium]